MPNMMSVNAENLERAVVKRIDDDRLCYLNVGGKTVTFSPDAIHQYGGQPFADLGIREGGLVAILRDANGCLTAVFPLSTDITEPPDGLIAADGVGKTSVEDPAPTIELPLENIDQSELVPTASAVRRVRPGRALPWETRQFGKLVDTSALQAGDLLLSRDVGTANWISTNVSDVQTRIGYGPSDARWIHAAMYLGNGYHVVEATIDSLMAGGDVRITHLDQYCDGKNILRFRRSTAIKEERQGWCVCVEALAQLGKPYSIGQTLRAWYDVRIGGAVAYEARQENILADAIVCSTLFASSFNRALRLSLGETNGICVPAWLSATDSFTDLTVPWLEIAQ